MSATTEARPRTAPTGPRSPRGITAELTGTGTLLRFVLRRDRVRLAVWTASVVLLYAYFVNALTAL